MYQLSMAKCISNLSSVSLWGSTGITDTGVVQLISGARSLQHLNIGGTFITDTSLFAIADSCPHLKVNSHYHFLKLTRKILVMATV
nr:F-box protein At5g67140 [Ipomoea batatas]